MQQFEHEREEQRNRLQQRQEKKAQETEEYLRKQRVSDRISHAYHNSW